MWGQVTSSINNLIIGKIYIDHGGIMRIRSNCGLVAKLKFHETGMLTREAHLVGPLLRLYSALLEFCQAHPLAGVHASDWCAQLAWQGAAFLTCRQGAVSLTWWLCALEFADNDCSGSVLWQAVGQQCSGRTAIEHD